MNVQHVNIKLFVQNPEAIDLTDFISIFNGWIQAQANDELLIDVADYRHVFAGPGVVLIGHEANYSLDHAGNRNADNRNADNRSGLLYNRKAQLNGSTTDRIEQALRSALLACHRLEAEPLLQGKLKFSGQAVQLFINDRLIAPNTAETFAALSPVLMAVFDRLYGGAEYTLTRTADPRERFTVNVTTAARLDVDALLRNLSLEPEAVHV